MYLADWKESIRVQEQLENRFHNVQFMNEGFGRECRATLLNPTVAVLLGDVADW
jgi:hypothetical protein